MAQEERDELGFRLKRICDEIERTANQEAVELGLTFVQGSVLLFLHDMGGNCGQCEVERYLNISHPAVGGILRRMEQKKLISCAFDAKDRRVKNVYLTPAGEALYPKVLAIRHRADWKLHHTLTRQELDSLYDLLDRVYDHLGDQQEAP